MSGTALRDVAGVVAFGGVLGASVALGTFTAWPFPVWVQLATFAVAVLVLVRLQFPDGAGCPLRNVPVASQQRPWSPADVPLPLFDQAPAPVLDVNRCAVCGWPLWSPARPLGCERGNCAQRPAPDSLYDPERAAREYAPHTPPSGGD